MEDVVDQLWLEHVVDAVGAGRGSESESLRCGLVVGEELVDVGEERVGSGEVGVREEVAGDGGCIDTFDVWEHEDGKASGARVFVEFGRGRECFVFGRGVESDVIGDQAQGRRELAEGLRIDIGRGQYEMVEQGMSLRGAVVA
jgi:hypothetical protein